ncbi:gametocyte-specific factor 1-like [Tetranychus urticae]|uniref:CHHC U11-48K-type domain-containing protein n=1 Tax=Tetranychus urticae TaxID=32264 RepID=T1KQ98_TETUR|nr:gametocyte-specific factor 1-like [Tetranychus urticae]
MATFYFDGDKLQQCPYQPHHLVLSRRMLAHMSKCAKDPNSPKLKKCHFNSLHRVKPYETEIHVMECGDNRQAIREMFNPVVQPSKPAINTQPQTDNTQDSWENGGMAKEYLLPGSEDNHAIEVDSDSFIPIQKPCNMTKAERKRLYNQFNKNAIKRKRFNCT